MEQIEIIEKDLNQIRNDINANKKEMRKILGRYELNNLERITKIHLISYVLHIFDISINIYNLTRIVTTI